MTEDEDRADAELDAVSAMQISDEELDILKPLIGAMARFAFRRAKLDQPITGDQSSVEE